MIFFIFFSTVLLSVYSYVGWRLVWTLQVPSLYKFTLIAIILFFYFLIISTFIFYFNNIENNVTRIIAWLGYAGLGTVSLLFFEGEFGDAPVVPPVGEPHDWRSARAGGASQRRDVAGSKLEPRSQAPSPGPSSPYCTPSPRFGLWMIGGPIGGTFATIYYV